MKRICSILLAMVLALSLAVPAIAAAPEQGAVSTETVYFEDGSYLVTTLVIFPSTRANQTTSGSKSSRYYNYNGSVEWTVTLTGAFSYDGYGATCRDASCSVSINTSSWSYSNKYAYPSGASAVGGATMTYTHSGVSSTQRVNLSLTCDKNGNIS